MKKRAFAMILAMALVLSCIPAQPARAEITSQEDLESIIAQQYDAYVKSLKAEGASEGVSQLVKHSMKGDGTLHMDENDKFVKALFSSQMFRKSFVHAATVAISQMQSTGDQILFMRSTYGWYENDMDYGNSVWIDNENGDDTDDIHVVPLIRASQDPYDGPVNTYDDGMVLVVGRASGKFTYQKVSADRDFITYHVSIQMTDTFDFNGADYSGQDNSLAQTLTWLGRLLSLGMLTTYNWSVSEELMVTVPNSCTHESADYSWVYHETEGLISTTENGYSLNELQKKENMAEDGTVSSVQYSMEKRTRLRHDRPWEIEIRCSGDKEFFLREQSTISGGRYFRKAKNTAFFGESVYLNEEDEKSTLTHYGVWFTKNGPAQIKSADMHTYRLSNKVFADGSNMVYLYIDDMDFGPMNHYYHVATSQNATVDWANGKDLFFSSISVSSGSYADATFYLDYVKVWENGKGNPAYGYSTTKDAAPTCTEDGGLLKNCTLCGAVIEIADLQPALGHSFGPWKLTQEATCGREGQEKRTCATCGETETRQLSKLEHSFPETWELTKEATCKEAGEETKTCPGCGEMQMRELPKADHKYISETVEPTCIERGYTKHTCTWCGSGYKDSQVNALGHKPGTFTSDGNTTCTKDGTMSAVCTRCEMKLTIQEEAYGHDYKNGTCSRCGEKDESYVPEVISFAGVNMTLGNALDMNFFVNQSDIEGTDNYAVITKHYADGRDDKVVKIPQSQWEKLGSSMYYFTFSGVTAKEMGDEFEVVIYNADGEAVSEVKTDSIQAYSRRMLDKAETKETAKSLYVEMLNYGAAAQVKFGYDTENLVNSVVTAEEQETYGISKREYENIRQTAEGYKGTSLTLESRILLNIVYEASYVTEGSYAIATFTNHNGKEMEDRADTFELLGPYLYASFTKMSVADRSQLLTITLYDADGNVINTVQDTVEGYVARMDTSDPLYEAIMKFADAAYQYFHN